MDDESGESIKEDGATAAKRAKWEAKRFMKRMCFEKAVKGWNPSTDKDEQTPSENYVGRWNVQEVVIRLVHAWLGPSHGSGWVGSQTSRVGLVWIVLQ